MLCSQVRRDLVYYYMEHYTIMHICYNVRFLKLPTEYSTIFITLLNLKKLPAATTIVTYNSSLLFNKICAHILRIHARQQLTRNNTVGKMYKAICLGSCALENYSWSTASGPTTSETMPPESSLIGVLTLGVCLHGASYATNSSVCTTLMSTKRVLSLDSYFQHNWNVTFKSYQT